MDKVIKPWPFGEGYLAGLRLLLSSSCPYVPGCTNFSEWQQGHSLGLQINKELMVDGEPIYIWESVLGRYSLFSRRNRELGCVHYSAARTEWHWFVIDYHDCDGGVEGQEPTAALAAYALVRFLTTGKYSDDTYDET